jgi:carboxyl-terminal processing protease
LRNLIFLLATASLSLLCYGEAGRNRYSGILSESIDKISRYYVEPVDSRQLFEGGLRGMLNELDPYSGYIPPEDYSQFRVEMEQQFGGIGVEVGMEDDRLTILNPIPGSPAYEAGILAGDVILGIDGQDVRGMPLDEAVQIMRGPQGKTVQVKIQRRGEPEPREYDLVRAEIPVESVRGDWRDARGQWHYTLREDPRIGYIRLASFGDRSVEEMRVAWSQVDGQIDGLVLDLRGNAGGLLTAAIGICEMFLPPGEVVVSTRGREGATGRVYRSNGANEIDPKLPVVVLVDRFSASASEIVAACLQDYQRATIVGERTWGKGTVQNLIDIEGGRSAIRLTTQTYWRPSGANIHRHQVDTKEDTWGVQPQEEDKVEFTVDEFRQVQEARRRRDYPFMNESGQEQTPANEAPREQDARTQDAGTQDAGDEGASRPEASASSTSESTNAANPSAAGTSLGELQPARDSDPGTPTATAPPVDGGLTVDRQLQRALRVLRTGIQPPAVSR